MKKLVILLFLCCPLIFYGQQEKYKVIAYFTGNGQTIQQYPVHKLTHIIYSFLKLQNDTLTFHNEQQKQTLQQLVQLKKQYPQLNVMVSIGGWSGCAPCSDLFASAEHRRVFAKTTVELFKQYSIDGLDLDWEYPAIEGFPGHKYSVQDKDNFTALVKQLREEMGNNYLLSFAAGGFINYIDESIDWDKVMPLVDFVNIMTYDLVGGYSTVTGHHTPLRSYRNGQESTEKAVDRLLGKIARRGRGDRREDSLNNYSPRTLRTLRESLSSKLIIGAAFYARVWENVADSNHGLYQSGHFKQGVAYKSFTTYFSDSSGYHYYWDKKAKAPFQYNPSKKLFATFDDQRSIREKTKFIREKKLGGIMFWELSQDKTAGGLVDEIYKGLGKK